MSYKNKAAKYLRKILCVQYCLFAVQPEAEYVLVIPPSLAKTQPLVWSDLCFLQERLHVELQMNELVIQSLQIELT